MASLRNKITKSVVVSNDEFIIVVPKTIEDLDTIELYENGGVFLFFKNKKDINRLFEKDLSFIEKLRRKFNL